MPEGACDVVILRSHCEDGEFSLVEGEDLTHVLDDGSQGDHDVGEGVAVDGAEVGVGDVLELGALEVAVGGFDDVAHSVDAAPFIGAVVEVLFVLQSAGIGLVGILADGALHCHGQPRLGAACELLLVKARGTFEYQIVSLGRCVDGFPDVLRGDKGAIGVDEDLGRGVEEPGSGDEDETPRVESLLAELVDLVVEDVLSAEASHRNGVLAVLAVRVGAVDDDEVDLVASLVEGFDHAESFADDLARNVVAERARVRRTRSRSRGSDSPAKRWPRLNAVPVKCSASLPWVEFAIYPTVTAKKSLGLLTLERLARPPPQRDLVQLRVAAALAQRA